MSICETCGNEYEHAMVIHLHGKEHFFDCFECAIQALAPECAQCGVKVVGHGVEVGSSIYCCAHCARQMGERGFCDHIRGRPEAVQPCM